MLRRIPALGLLVSLAVAQGDTLGLSHGFLSFNTSTLRLQLVKDSQTAYLISPAASSFNFVPADMMVNRSANAQYHLGDITFRARVQGATAWTSGNSAAARRPVTALAAGGSTLAAADLTPTLGAAGTLLKVVRRWALLDGTLQMLFDVTNVQTSPVEIGAIGAPLEFNNIFTGRSAADTNEKCSLFDPYIGADAGFVQVTPLLGTLPPLLVLPAGKSPLEGWRFLQENTGPFPYYQSQTFEALYEWSFHTLAYARSEWASVMPWNAPTSAVLQPNETRTYGLRFVLAPSIRGIDAALQGAGHPVANAIPGYVVAQDRPAKLFLHHSAAVSGIAASPAGALSWTRSNDAVASGWVVYEVSGVQWGRARLSVTYADGTLQTVHFYVTKSGPQLVSDLGNFLTTSQWFTNTSDPFKRAPSVISFDRETNKQVVDEARAWIAGLSDEAGAGSWLAATMKQFLQPNAAEVAKLEQFVSKVMFGVLQNTDFSVKKSVYFYDRAVLPSYNYPSSINYGNWWSWNQHDAFLTDRAYDYVHVAAAYWALYRVARNYPALVATHNWQWYINQALATVLRMVGGGVGYTNDGLMGETVFWFLLNDLKREGLNSNATALENAMRRRQSAWAGQRYPFGSEMAWDSTGQEGVFVWSQYFNDSKTATNSLNSILAFQPTVPHWGYDGNARRYWDNVYGGKLQRIERQLHHYGSGLNAIPLLFQFQANPSDLYLLRVGYAGMLGPTTNVDQAGFASASFHSFPDTLKWDGYSGDYGPNFSGHSMGIGTFIVQHPLFGWQAYGGRVKSTSPTVDVDILDDGRRRVFVAPLGALFALDAGAFVSASVNVSKRSVAFVIAVRPSTAPNAASAAQGRIVVTQTATVAGVGKIAPTSSLSMDAGAYVVPLTSGSATVTFSA
ncbi:hypothetical protein AURDEDRAFT_169168 [Auricularia subglabra TFB-10046 SS5]|nr:hypothetical protein AURDEDRAFT_169168 [Auricularia subglabra TFB-10046 SS5]